MSLVIEENKCKLPETIPHGDFVVNEDVIKSGTIAFIKCDEGYKSDGKFFVTCTDSGKFDAELPICVETICDVNLSENLKVEGGVSNVQVGKVVRYHCSEGYDLLGANEATCLNDGEFNVEQPKCVKSK